MKHVALSLKDKVVKARCVDKPYKAFQKHLNTLPAGIPAMLSGVELRLLKAMFTIDEAQLTRHMDWHFETVNN